MRHDPPEYYVLARSLGGKVVEEPAGCDWLRLLEIASREGVLPAMHTRLACPAEISDFFDAIHELNAIRNRQLLRELEALGLLLNAAGIEPVLLKGSAYLVSGVYSDPADRWNQDIDLLLDPRESHDGFEIISRSGYTAQVAKQTAFGRHHHPVLTKDGCIPVEVHHSLGLGRCGRFLTAEELIHSSTRLQIGGATVRVPSAEHLMTHLIMHSQMHHGSYDRVWPSLRAMVDVLSVSRRFTIPWEAIRRRFEFHNQGTLLTLHLKQVEKVLDFASPFPLSSGNIRWKYRQALWRTPALRYFDPSYLFSRVLLDKLQVSRRLLKDPMGRKFVMSTPFRSSFYRKLFMDIAKG